MGFPQQLEVQEVVRDGAYWLALSGELDLASASLLQETVNDLAGEAISAVVLDLSGLTFMDSTGVRATLAARELCERRGYRFSLISGPAQVQRLFELTGLLDVLPFAPDGDTDGAASS
ncbi:MAG TPA: STAS domain-containing protein [Solirubrobacteraceae bacterium]|jgi:anti-sigma B factor antagonist|nr:STAS domain-containing protein [Solirubrobacteraceae bacterium]